jgi:hypothetical protein
MATCGKSRGIRHSCLRTDGCNTIQWDPQTSPLVRADHSSSSTIAAAGDNNRRHLPGLIARLVVLRRWLSFGPGISNRPIRMPRRWNARMRPYSRIAV